MTLRRFVVANTLEEIFIEIGKEKKLSNFDRQFERRQPVRDSSRHFVGAATVRQKLTSDRVSRDDAQRRRRREPVVDFVENLRLFFGRKVRTFSSKDFEQFFDQVASKLGAHSLADE